MSLSQAELWGPEKSPGLGRDGAAGIPASAPSTSSWMGLAGAAPSPDGQGPAKKNSVKGEKQPVGELGKRTHHCLPF